MDSSSDAVFSPHVTQVAAHFGALLKVVRYRQDCKQIDVLAHLQGWTQTMYSRLESGEAAPAFKDLPALYTALFRAGILLTPLERSQFLTLARERIEAKRSRQDHHSEQEWDTLHLTLARIGQPHERTLPSTEEPALAVLRETRHLVGRQNWLRSVVALFSEVLPKKLVVLQGPAGVGKSSELHRLALRVLESGAPRRRVVLCDLPATEHDLDPESALDLFLATILAEVGTPGSVLPMASLSVRIRLALQALEQSSRPVLLLLDNAEHLLNQRGMLAACWEQLLAQFLGSPHSATLLLATREWRGWAGRDGQLVAEMTVPLLTGEESVQVLRRLGLEEVPIEQVQALGERVAGIPLCLEWLARLARDPLELDAWWDPAAEEQNLSEQRPVESITRRVQRLLEEPELVGGHLASHVRPLLQRLLDTHLSKGARQVLEQFAVATIPLGGSALQRLCPRPALLKELRDASLLAAAANRVQVLPMVAALLTAQRSWEQASVLEEHLLEALTSWLEEGMMGTSEAGGIVAELATLYLKQHRLLEVAELLIRYGWLSFNQGYGSRLARLTQDMLHDFDWHSTEEYKCAGLVLTKILFPFLGKPVHTQEYRDYEHIRDAFLTGKVILQPAIEGYLIHLFFLDAMNAVQFEEAQAILNTYRSRLESRQVTHLEQHPSLLQKQALLLGTWCEYAEEQGEIQKAQVLREKTIALYRQRVALLNFYGEEEPLLKRGIRKRDEAYYLTYLGYHLNRIGQYEEALRLTERAINLQEQGYTHIGVLAASYGEKSQILMALGRFQEAVLFDEKAIVEAQRYAKAGDALSCEEFWIYQVNHGRLCLRLGRIDEAERIFREALPHIHARRRTYRMFARDALEEIEEWRRQAKSPHHQLDWRWVERYRELSAYDSYWWLTWAGPFTEEEQHQWEHLFSQPLDEARREQLGILMRESRDRELLAALEEQREPRLHYPAIAIEDVRRRIMDLLQLDADIGQQEPNAVVRRLYQGAIEEELDFLRLIEATFEGDTERFWEYNLRLLPVPTQEDMEYALSHVRHTLFQGLHHPETAEISQCLQEFLTTRLLLSFDLTSNEETIQKEQRETPGSSSPSRRKVSAQATRDFFEAVLRESGYEDWQVVIDPNASGARVEQGLRQMFLPEKRFTTDEIRHLFSHELAGHVARCMAGEHSLLGLLGIHTKNSLPTEEGLALYHERQVTALHGQTFDDSGIWLGTLAVGLACGVVTPPQTFLSLFTFLESFFLLRRLLKQPDIDLQKARQQVRTYTLSMCLRKYRGVSNLEQAGVCYLQDAVYLRGLRMIEHAVAEDETVLDRLAVGVCALELLPDLQELGILTSPQPLRKLAYAPELDDYILSFEHSREISDEYA